MKKFKCHKVVNAKPMTLGDYNILRKWDIPTNENPEDEGYLVEYLDSPNKTIHPDFDNYISWSPKEVFEQGYTELSKSMTGGDGPVKPGGGG